MRISKHDCTLASAVSQCSPNFSPSKERILLSYFCGWKTASISLQILPYCMVYNINPDSTSLCSWYEKTSFQNYSRKSKFLWLLHLLLAKDFAVLFWNSSVKNPTLCYVCLFFVLTYLEQYTSVLCLIFIVECATEQKEIHTKEALDLFV